MDQDAHVATIAHIIQLAVAPVFLLAGIGSLLGVFGGRMARIVDRARRLEELLPTADVEPRGRMLTELAILDRRMAVVHWAINFAIVAALLVCLVVALLFVADLTSLHIGPVVAILFIAAMGMLTLGLSCFLVEVGMATRFVRVSAEYSGRRNRLR
jgi:hypothetical protein